MDRRSLIGGLGALFLGGLGLSSPAESLANDESQSPHSEAIALVIKKQQDQIGKAEEAYFKKHGVGWWKGELRQYRWHDTIQRSWSAVRPVAPGVTDSTHLFIITYSINDQ